MRSQTSAFYFSYKVSTVACNPDTDSLVRKLIYVTHSQRELGTPVVGMHTAN